MVDDDIAIDMDAFQVHTLDGCITHSLQRRSFDETLDLTSGLLPAVMFKK